jgi:hypothetical protein
MRSILRQANGGSRFGTFPGFSFAVQDFGAARAIMRDR